MVFIFTFGIHRQISQNFENKIYTPKTAHAWRSWIIKLFPSSFIIHVIYLELSMLISVSIIKVKLLSLNSLQIMLSVGL